MSWWRDRFGFVSNGSSYNKTAKSFLWEVAFASALNRLCRSFRGAHERSVYFGAAGEENASQPTSHHDARVELYTSSWAWWEAGGAAFLQSCGATALCYAKYHSCERYVIFFLGSTTSWGTNITPYCRLMADNEKVMKTVKMTNVGHCFLKRSIHVNRGC